MALLTDLLNKIGVKAVPGTWNIGPVNLPDTGYTELRNVATGGDTKNPTYNNPAVYAAVGGVPQSQNVQPLTDTYRSLGILPSNSSVTSSPQKTASTNNAPGGTWTLNANGDPVYKGPDTGNDVGQAQDAYRARINAILQQVGLMRDIAARSLDRARSVRDEIVGNITDTYKGLEDTAATKLQSTLDTLNTEGVNVENQYGRAEGQSRKAMEGALLKNRMLARAMNRLNSSFYEDRQAGVTEDTAKSISDIGTERAGKLSGIETRKSENKNWFDQETLKIQQEGASLKSAADRDYQQQVDNANYNEQAFGIDSVEGLQAAADEYQSRISKIEDYVNNRALTLAGIAAQSGGKASEINAYEAISPTLKSTLENARAYNAAKDVSANLPVFNSSNVPTGLADPLAFYKQQDNTESAYNKILARLDPRRAAALGISSFS